jgi:hypothetical protein
LVRLSDSLFFAPQSDSEKKKNAIRKSSARNDQIRGLFGSLPYAGFYFSDTEESRAKPELGLERESRAKPELRLRTSPRSAYSAFCLLHRRPRKFGGRRRAERERERESRAKAELRLRTRSPPPLKEEARG